MNNTTPTTEAAEKKLKPNVRRCKYVLTRGANRGRCCNKNCSYSDYCTVEHQKQHEAQKLGLTLKQHEEQKRQDFIKRYGMSPKSYKRENDAVQYENARVAREKRVQEEENKIKEDLKEDPDCQLKYITKVLDKWDYFYQEIGFEFGTGVTMLEDNTVQLLNGKKYKLGWIPVE